jgi:hypothetical protein
LPCLDRHEHASRSGARQQLVACGAISRRRLLSEHTNSSRSPQCQQTFRPKPRGHWQGRGAVLLAAVPDAGAGRSQIGCSQGRTGSPARLRFLRRAIRTGAVQPHRPNDNNVQTFYDFHCKKDGDTVDVDIKQLIRCRNPRVALAHTRKPLDHYADAICSWDRSRLPIDVISKQWREKDWFCFECRPTKA